MSAVRVAVRTRPTSRFAADNIIPGDNNQLTVHMKRGENPNAQDSWSWKFDSVMHNASQETVYLEQVAPIVASVLQGYNGTVMSYGQTGSGKTFTQIGSVESYQNRGLTPRALAEIFSYLSEQPQLDATVAVSYVEIYQDTLIDLLSSLPTAQPITEPLVLVEDKNGVTSVKNLRQQVVSSEEEALAMLFEGQTNRQVANHQLNRASTRGHAIFTVHLRIRSRVDSSGVVTKCKLNLVDLAGSERLKKTATEGGLRSESMYINRSLTFLEQVVVALSSKGRSHTPYRQSKLTHLLKDSLGGNCKTLLIANVYGEVTHLEETISTLQFAARVRLVPNEASLNTEADPETLLKKYALEIQDLKRELSMHNSLASRSRIAYEPYSDAQRVALMEELQTYLADSDDACEIELESVRQMRELLSAMKALYSEQTSEIERMSKIIATGGPLNGNGDNAGDASAPADGSGEAGEEGGEGVGTEAIGKRGIALGHAPDGAKPAGGLVEPPAYQREPGDALLTEGGANAPPVSPGADSIGVLGREEAFALFKKTEGAVGNERLLQAKQALKELKKERADAVAAVNQAKSDIETAKKKMQAKKEERLANVNTVEDAEIIDEEEFHAIQENKTAKQTYKIQFDVMKTKSEAIKSSELEVDHAREALLTDFNEWYRESFNETADVLAHRAPPEPKPQAEVMDDDEQFEQLQMQRVLEESPESLAFVRARRGVNFRAQKRR